MTPSPSAPPPAVLDHQPPTLSLTMRIARMVTASASALWRRKPWAADLLVLGWLMICAATVSEALATMKANDGIYIPPLYQHVSLFYCFSIIFGGFWGVMRQRRWRELLICACIVLVTGVASGAVGFGSCPHATYFQVAGFYVPVMGNPCANPQHYSLLPWWAR